ncbi:hypothetical protein RBSH_00356 [Rhodopirellula baltica SH28]|uniref:Uncharacterized protein n=1 Tax=Rhodopirellula baltica SH28 TaxID=993517 RepID=K5DN79_RHOBT|nr:hypothetical protein RBSH_00356 [Rhodopirellula baltica SH28]
MRAVLRLVLDVRGNRGERQSADMYGLRGRRRTEGGEDDGKTFDKSPQTGPAWNSDRFLADASGFDVGAVICGNRG